jgi:hypothetical protein
MKEVHQNSTIAGRQALHPTKAILTRRGDQVARQDRWPTKDDIGQLVLLPEGEVGVLIQWWKAEGGSEWRWQAECYNQRERG